MRKIALVTGSRAEYWLLRPLIRTIPSQSLMLLVTGDHLAGAGIKKIQDDEFDIHREIECLPQEDTYLGMTKAISRGVANFADALSEIKPDIVVLLGDRYETFAAASASYSLKIPIAHIHGGEVTRGALDDGYRHSISKMANLHFVSHEDYRRRLLNMGEEPERVYNVGAIGLDNLSYPTEKHEENFFQKYPFLKGQNYFLVTLHAPTLSNEHLKDQANALISALNEFPEYQVVVTQSNRDPGGVFLNELWEEWTKKDKRIHFIPTLGDDYLLAAHFSKMVIGNSSSGILEIPYLDRPVLDIGNRQEGRVIPKGVYNTDFNAEMLRSKICDILKTYKGSEKVYGIPGEISNKISEILQSISLETLIYKRFNDAK